LPPTTRHTAVAQVLESYCSWLENRVVSRFDAAVNEDNLQAQAQVVGIMTQLEKERSIAQVGGSGWVDAGGWEQGEHL
jgi:hypothetical protein